MLGQLGRHSNMHACLGSRHGCEAWNACQCLERAYCTRATPIDASSDVVVHCACKPRSSKGVTCRTTTPLELEANGGVGTTPMSLVEKISTSPYRAHPVEVHGPLSQVLTVGCRVLGASPSPTRTSASPTTGEYPTTALRAARRRKS
jgi:hypothetical protein